MLPPGTQLGRYTVREHLGAGGMGDVYLAVDPNLDRTVAIKVLPEALAADPDRLARFVREARAVSALNHPNILSVFDFDHKEGVRFLVTEFIDGRTLRQWHAEERPPLDELLDAMAQAASALAVAHEAGIVHRDIKPENLMRRRDGFVKVLDFGIAKLVGDSRGGADPGGNTGEQLETRPGTILGTTRYMSPEQALGSSVDARSDVWSLGVVLYELVAGKAPFVGPTPMGTLAMIMGHEPEPLDAAAPGTPEAVCAMVARALRKQRDARFATAAEMAAELTRAAQAVRSGSAPTPDQDAVGTIAFEVRGAARSSDDQRPTNLPPRTSALIGRERECDEVTALLRAGDVRLVTLTGAGGTGKTRLAVEAGCQLLGDFADGVFAVELAELTDPGQIASHVAAVFSLKESAGSELAAELVRFLAQKQTLLVLDNFEQLVAGAPFVAELLAAAPGLKVLATSQAPLRLRAEREYALEPLTVPVFASLPPIDELERTPAVALFVERARAARPSFELTTDNARTVVEICRRLDGLPLALELAAARIKLLSPQAMLERLDQRLKLLTGGARDLPARQQTMRGAVAWSYDLLDDAEQAVLRRLAVFAGGCMLDAAEAVCGSGGVDVLDAIGSLAEKSLLRQHELADGEIRFTMLAVVREFAIEQLEASAEAGDARLEHARYFRSLAAKADLWSAEQVARVEQLKPEYDNLVAAIALLLEREPAEGAALVLDMGTFCKILCLYSQRRTWCMNALETGVAPELRARLLNSLSNCELHLGNFRAAAERSRDAVEANREHGERRALALALNGLGQALMTCDDLRGARDAHEEGLGISRELGDRKLAAVFLNGLGEIDRNVGDFGAARAAYERALEESGRQVHWNLTAITLVNLASAALALRDVAAASGHYREALSIAAEIGDLSLIADAIDGLAAVALETGGADRAARLAAAADAICERSKVPREPHEQELRNRYEAALRASLDPVVLEREWARGGALTLDEAVEAALGD